MRSKGVYSISKTKSRQIGAFKTKFLKIWRANPVSIVHESLPSHTNVPSISHRKTDEFVYILSGRAVACLGKKEKPVKKGDYLLIPRGTGHAFRTGSVKMDAISVFSPPMNLVAPDVNVENTNERPEIGAEE